MKPVIAIDIDNTICNTNQKLAAFVPNLDITKYPSPGVTNDIFSTYPEIFIDALPLTDAVKKTNHLALFYEIVYLTARPKWSKDITSNWLKKHSFPGGEVIYTNNKAKYIKKRSIILALEDAPEEIKLLSQIIPVFIHMQPYNKNLRAMGHFTWETLNIKEVYKYE